MPVCPGTHRARIGQFSGIFIALLEKKARKCGKTRKYNPYCTWDCYTEASYRIVISTFCAVTFLLSAHCALALLHSPQLSERILGWCSGNIDKRPELNMPCMFGTNIHSHGQDIFPGSSASGDSEAKSYSNPTLPSLLILSGDVEVNPGPSTEQLIDALGKRLEDKIDNFSAEFKSMNAKINSMVEKLEGVTQQLREKEKDLDEMKKRVDSLENAMEDVENELEKHEIFSRRDNIIFYGLPERSTKESHDECAKTVADIINRTATSNREWRKEDFARAHRLGKPSGKHRPIIAKLQRSRDKQSLITDKQLRNELKKEGVSISDDLTLRQRQTLREERERGFMAYFRGPRLFTRPATQRRRSNDSDDSTQEDLPRNPAQQSTTAPSSRSPTAQDTDTAASPISPVASTPNSSAVWQQFRRRSRERGGGPAQTKKPGTSEAGGRSQDNGTSGGNVQTRSRQGKKQNRIDQMLGSGTRKDR